MFPHLEQLEDYVRQAKASVRAQKLESETNQAAESLRESEARMARIEQRLKVERPDLVKKLDQAETAKRRCDEVIREIAKNHLNSDRSILETIEKAQAEIAQTRAASQAELDAIAREADEAKHALQSSREAYLRIRAELDQLQPRLAGNYAEVDRLARAAELYLPEGKIQALAREVEDSIRVFGMLSREEQYAQLMIWIGSYRGLQDRIRAEPLADGDQATLDRIFPMLRDLSHEHRPGHIEAFNRGFSADWDAYVDEARDRLHAATEQARRGREVDQVRQQRQVRDQDNVARTRESVKAAAAELRAVLGTSDPLGDGQEAFLEAVRKVVAAGGSADPDILHLVLPYVELLQGKEYRALRRNLDRLGEDDAKLREDSGLRERFAELIAQTRGKSALMIGGAVREDARRSLQSVFEFDELEWEPYEGSRPVLLASLEQRVKNRGMDLVLILKEFVAHAVPERLRPLCQENGIPCLMVEHGYGANQVADALVSSQARARA